MSQKSLPGDEIALGESSGRRESALWTFFSHDKSFVTFFNVILEILGVGISLIELQLCAFELKSTWQSILSQSCLFYLGTAIFGTTQSYRAT